MSFSTELKEEISKVETLSNKEAVKYELMGYLISSNISVEKNKINDGLSKKSSLFYFLIY